MLYDAAVFTSNNSVRHFGRPKWVNMEVSLDAVSFKYPRWRELLRSDLHTP